MASQRLDRKRICKLLGIDAFNSNTSTTIISRRNQETQTTEFEKYQIQSPLILKVLKHNIIQSNLYIIYPFLFLIYFRNQNNPKKVHNTTIIMMIYIVMRI